MLSTKGTFGKSLRKHVWLLSCECSREFLICDTGDKIDEPSDRPCFFSRHCPLQCAKNEISFGAFESESRPPLELSVSSTVGQSVLTEHVGKQACLEVSVFFLHFAEAHFWIETSRHFLADDCSNIGFFSC